MANTFDKDAYSQYVTAHAPKSPLLRDCLRAFLMGGLICTLAEGLSRLYHGPCGLSKQTAGTLASVTLVAIAAILTYLSVFDCLAKVAGAGTLVPITGFANAVVSPAIDSRSEGLVLGVGAKIFTVVGPVLLYGTVAGVLYGVIYWVWTLF